MYFFYIFLCTKLDSEPPFNLTRTFLHSVLRLTNYTYQNLLNINRINVSSVLSWEYERSKNFIRERWYVISVLSLSGTLNKASSLGTAWFKRYKEVSVAKSWVPLDTGRLMREPPERLRASIRLAGVMLKMNWKWQK